MTLQTKTVIVNLIKFNGFCLKNFHIVCFIVIKMKDGVREEEFLSNLRSAEYSCMQSIFFSEDKRRNGLWECCLQNQATMDN